jgi:hypothetical protein
MSLRPFILTIHQKGFPSGRYELSKDNLEDAKIEGIELYCRKHGLGFLPAPGEPDICVKFENPDA